MNLPSMNRAVFLCKHLHLFRSKHGYGLKNDYGTKHQHQFSLILEHLEPISVKSWHFSSEEVLLIGGFQDEQGILKLATES